TLLRKPLVRPQVLALEIVEPATEQGVLTSATPNGLEVEAAIRGGQAKKVTARIDDADSLTADLPGGGTEKSMAYRAVIPTSSLVPGAHYVHVTADLPELQLERSSTFLVPGGQESRVYLSAGMKAQPLVIDEQCLAATT